MKTPDFQKNLAAAKAFQAAVDDPSFWEGYVRGLRRHYHGAQFGTEEEHMQWMALADEQGDEQRIARGKGYRAGITGTPVSELVEFQV